MVPFYCSCDASVAGPAFAYTQVLGGPSSPNLSAESSIARQAVWLDRRLMAAGRFGTNGANGGAGVSAWQCLGVPLTLSCLHRVWLSLLRLIRQVMLSPGACLTQCLNLCCTVVCGFAFLAAALDRLCYLYHWFPRGLS